MLWPGIYRRSTVPVESGLVAAFTAAETLLQEASHGKHACSIHSPAHQLWQSHRVERPANTMKAGDRILLHNYEQHIREGMCCDHNIIAIYIYVGDCGVFSSSRGQCALLDSLVGDGFKVVAEQVTAEQVDQSERNARFRTRSTFMVCSVRPLEHLVMATPNDYVGRNVHLAASIYHVKKLLYLLPKSWNRSRSLRLSTSTEHTGLQFINNTCGSQFSQSICSLTSTINRGESRAGTIQSGKTFLQAGGKS